MLTGATDASRIIQGRTHRDPYAALEDSSSPEFKEAVRYERSHWAHARKPEVERWERRYQEVLAKAMPKSIQYSVQSVWNGHTVHVQDTYSHLQHVWFNKELLYESITSLALGRDTYAVITDSKEGSETFTLTEYDTDHNVINTITPVGPKVAYLENTLVYQSVEKQLWYPGIVCGKKELYKETNPKVQLELLQPPYQDDVFVKASNALEQRLGLLTLRSIKWLTPFRQESIFPINTQQWLTNSHIGSQPLPEQQYGVDALVYKNTLYVITVSKGHHTLYEVKDTFIPLVTAPSIKFLTEADTPTVAVEYPWKPTEVVDIVKNKRLFTFPKLLALQHMTGSIDSIPYTIVFHGKPKRLLVSAYGAYGIESQRNYPIRWLPWIEKGYAYAVAMPRGGRDDGDAWWDAARTAPKKHRTFEDTARVIQAVQTRLHLSPSRTLFYGRSAGGWTAAMMVLQYTHLIRGVIAEVPYVDVLRTTSNPALPLTQMEYEEFGDPMHVKKDYEALLNISPVNITKPPPATITVLVKTAMHDTEVATYESLKWAATLREKGWPHVYVSIDMDGGHFVGAKTMARQLAEDAAFFHVAPVDTRKTSSHRTRGTTRRSKSSSKH